MKSDYTLYLVPCTSGHLLDLGAFNQRFSVRAMAAKVSADPSLGGRLKGVLSEDQTARTQSTINVEETANPRRCYSEPMVVPRSCLTCGNIYKRKLAMAKSMHNW